MNHPDGMTTAAELSAKHKGTRTSEEGLVFFEVTTMMLAHLAQIHEGIYELVNKPPATGNFIDLQGSHSVRAESVVTVSKRDLRAEFFIDVTCQDGVLYVLGNMSRTTRDIKYDLIMCQLKGVEKAPMEYGNS